MVKNPALCQAYKLKLFQWNWNSWLAATKYEPNCRSKSVTVSEFYSANLYETRILTLKPINQIFVAENPFCRSKTILSLKKLFMKRGPGVHIFPFGHDLQNHWATPLFVH